MAATPHKFVNSGLMRLVAIVLALVLALIAAFVWLNTEPWVETVPERAEDLQAYTTSSDIQTCIANRSANIDQLVEQELMTAEAGEAARKDIEATCAARGEQGSLGDRTRNQGLQE
ncbi:hypothetical protein FP2506_17904 [Fulvimarina pelagi HTCC2506]|uniref:Uncharacterized protein n=1 Tax=Fulvimarina pelagi HTCC2506 TaxID=314231 RepID=Q0G152_9HYPH|nr:hypothetical protein [Fulvimarina pelagi]EAU40787.1 hypothetical protein FP2506_17904 [Fulvimarina pelagi HTCC2506]